MSWPVTTKLGAVDLGVVEILHVPELGEMLEDASLSLADFSQKAVRGLFDDGGLGGTVGSGCGRCRHLP
jgi:hypothetical protein